MMKVESIRFLAAMGLLALVAISTSTYVRAQELELLHKINTLEKALIVEKSCSLANVILFSGDNGRNGLELWRVDKPTAGQLPNFDKAINIRETFAGPRDGVPNGCTSFKGKAYFAARDPQRGEALWVSDGTALGTKIVKDFHVGNSERIMNEVVASGSLLFLIVYNANDNLYELWVSDGTTAGTKFVQSFEGDFSTPKDLYPLPGGNVVFSAFKQGFGSELWLSDGKTAELVLDIEPGSTSSGPRDFQLVNGTQLYFIKDHGSSRALYVTNLAFDAALKIPFSEKTRFDQPAFAELNGKVYFRGSESGVSGIGLYATDGTIAGTSRIELGQTISSIISLRKVNSQLFFSSRINKEPHLFKSDGTAAGTKLVAALDSGFQLKDDESIVLGNRLLFTTRRDFKNEIWSTDGTASGTMQISVVRPGGTTRGVIPFGDEGDLAIFQSSAHHFMDSNITDASLNGTTRITFDPIPEVAQNSSTLPLSIVGDRLLYRGSNAEGARSYFSYDISDQQIRPIFPANFESDFIQYGEAVNDPDADYIIARDANKNYRLYLTGGSSDQFTNIFTSQSIIRPSQIAVIGGKTLFTCHINDLIGSELCVTDNTQAGTQLLADINPGANSSEPSRYQVFQNKLYFFADDGIHGREIWTSDGTQQGTELLVDTVEEFKRTSLASTAKHLFVVRELRNTKKVTISAFNGTAITEVYNEDGERPRARVSTGTRHYFTVEDLKSRQEKIIVSDGTVAGTKQLFSGDRIYSIFTADDVVFFVNRENDGFIVLYRYDEECDRVKEVIRYEGTFGSAVLRGDVILFRVRGLDNVRRLYLSDGSAPGTRELSFYIPSAKHFNADGSHRNIGQRIFLFGPNGAFDRDLYSFHLDDIQWGGLAVKECGCNHNLDGDLDGTFNCYDVCPSNPEKIESEGVCGCDLVDIDENGDKILECLADLCPDDFDKTEPGVCGCNVPDTDTDGDGDPDCIDNTSNPTPGPEAEELDPPQEAKIRFRRKRKGRKRTTIKVQLEDLVGEVRYIGELRLIPRRKKRSMKVTTFEGTQSKQRFISKRLRRFRFVEVAYSVSIGDKVSPPTVASRKIPRKFRRSRRSA